MLISATLKKKFFFRSNNALESLKKNKKILKKKFIRGVHFKISI